MKRLTPASLSVSLLLLLLLSTVSPAAAANRFILRPSSGNSAADVASRHGLTLVGALDQKRNLFFVTTPDEVPIQQTIQDVSSDLAVAQFEPDRSLAVAESPTNLSQSSVAILDSLPPASSVSYYGTPVLGAYLSQPATSLIRLFDEQTTFSVTGAGVVAIIDTGVDPNHIVLEDSLVPGYDFVNNAEGIPDEMADLSESAASVLQQSSASPADKSQIAVVSQSSVAILDQYTGQALDVTQLPPAFGHGTMVAGLVHLTAPTARIMPLKAFRSDGSANLSDILRAIYFAVDHGAKVINMSFSLLSYSAELDDAINYAEHQGVTCVASAGNLGLPVVTYPAALSKVIAVASTSTQDVRSAFSSYGPHTWIAAPGEGVITTYPGNNYAATWGTSFSTPFVAGGAALVVQTNPNATYSDISGALTHSRMLTQDLGHGRLDLYQVIAQQR